MTLPDPETVPTLDALNAIVRGLGLYFLNLEERSQLASSGGTFTLAAEIEDDGQPVVGYRFDAGRHVSDVADALEIGAPA